LKETGFLLSGLFAVIGVVTLLLTRIIQLVVPMLGRVAFQAAMKGSFNPRDYYIDFTGLQFAAGGLILFGIIVCYILYKQDN